MKGDDNGQKETEAAAPLLGVDLAHTRDRTVQRILARVTPPPTTACCGDRHYKIIRHESGAALRYERLESKADERLRKKAEKRARRAGAVCMKVNHLDLVVDEHRKQPPTSGVLSSVFAFQQRVLARLAREFPGERWGYLKKGGDNTLTHNGELVKVGRVCGPDAQLYKIGTDIPTTNAPIWNDDGILTVDFPGSTPDQWYMPFEGAPDVDHGDDGGTDAPPLDTSALVKALADLRGDMLVQLGALRQQFSHQEELTKQLADRLEQLHGNTSTRIEELKAIVKAGRTGTVKVPYLGSGPLEIFSKP